MPVRKARRAAGPPRSAPPPRRPDPQRVDAPPSGPHGVRPASSRYVHTIALMPHAARLRSRARAPHRMLAVPPHACRRHPWPPLRAPH
ncbi:hypothetical protein WM40_15670 [Robbsia andropogonis]|uniref:Uncharacterized protein n=1 Tax=Robbsia andropogonis TaxID=28092 RepID=A0A0F5JYH5_9BURK|nr:hypothetical protein WM40_15670 [Robbsia andropogonis]